MDAPRGTFYRKNPPDPMADVRDAMSRRDDFDDFDPIAEDYADESRTFEVQAALEALKVEREVLA